MTLPMLDTEKALWLQNASLAALHEVTPGPSSMLDMHSVLRCVVETGRRFRIRCMRTFFGTITNAISYSLPSVIDRPGNEPFRLSRAARESHIQWRVEAS